MEILKKLRENYDLTQKELGKMVGVTACTISLYEKGERRPDTSMVVQLARILG